MTISFQSEIRPLFRGKDIACMQKFGVALGDYAYMSDAVGDADYPDHAHARRVFCHLLADSCEPRMPMNGPYWSDDQLALFNQWMTDGFAP